MSELLFDVLAMPTEHQKRVARQLKSRAFCQEKRLALRTLAHLPYPARREILRKAFSDAVQKLLGREHRIVVEACDALSAEIRHLGTVGALELVTALGWALEELDWPEK